MTTRESLFFPARLIRGALLLPLLAWALDLALPSPAAADTALAALAEGNRLVADGRLEEAVTAYRQGYSPGAIHPTLAYNLGTALHQLGRLPEAILWYRRAGQNADPWLADNLTLARRSLGSQSFGQPGPLGGLAQYLGPLAWVAVGLSWAAAALVWRRRLTAAVALGVAALAVLALGGFTLLRAPKEAVLVADCSTTSGLLPAGSELWVQSHDNAWEIAGTDGTTCSADQVELIHAQP